jgi:anti-sigma factor RsiW
LSGGGNSLAEHLTDNLLRRYRQHALTAEELLRLDEHLQNCATCQTRLAADDETALKLAALHTDLNLDSDHLTYEDLAGYVDHSLNPAAHAHADSHLRDCQSCTAELDDLRAFRDELKDAPVLTNAPAPAGWRSWWDSLQWH